MRWMNILENKVSCKYLYEKTRTLLVHVQGTCRKPNIQTRETSTYMWTFTRLFCILFFYLQVSERFMNKQQTLIILPRKWIDLTRLRFNPLAKLVEKHKTAKNISIFLFH